MAVAAADFYTYARATGTPIPKSKQEEAELTPVVNRWKRERLNETRGEEGGNNIATLGALAGVGALTLAGLSRRPLQKRVQTVVSPPDDAITTGMGGLQRDLNKKVTTGADTPVSWEDTKKSWDTTREVVDPDLESLADEQIDIIRGTVANPKLYPQTTSEVRRQIARARKIEQQSDLVLKDLRQEAIEEAQSGKEMTAFRRKWGIDPKDPGAAVKNEEVWAKDPGGTEAYHKKVLSANDLLQQEGPGKYIDPEDVVTSPAGNVPKSETIDDQTINAIDAAEDQQTGRVVRNLQRNEDLDQGKIALLEDITEDSISSYRLPEGSYEADAAINKVASQLPDGLPVDQAEGFKATLGPGMQWYKSQSGGVVGASAGGPASVAAVKGIDPVGGLKQASTEPTSAQRFLQSERDEIASQLAEQNLPVTSGRIETELANRYGPKAYTYGSDYTKRKHALEFGATYDPKFFDDVDLPSVEIGGETVPVKPERRYTKAKTPYTGTKYLDDYTDSLKTPFYSEDTALQLQENVADKKLWLANVKEDVSRNIKALEEQATQIKDAQVVATNRGDQKTYNQLEVELNKLRGSYQKQQRRLSGAERTINKGIKEATVPLTMGEKAENAGKRIYTQRETGVRGQKVGRQLLDMDLADEVVDEIDTISSANIDPETVQLRSERRIINTEPKGGQGRKMAESGSPRPDNPLDTLVPLQQRGGALFDRNTNTWKLMADIPENNRGLSRQTTRPIVDATEPDIGVTETGGLELSPKIYEDPQGRVIDKYGIRLAEVRDSSGRRRQEVSDSVKNVPTGSLVSYRKPAGQRKDNTLNIAVTGGRKYQNYEELSQRLDEAVNQLNPAEGTNINIIAGGATGADKLAEKYARERNYNLTVKSANWTKHGKAAGPIRNREMAKLSDVGVAFPGGTGTQNMIQTMGQEGKPILNTAEIQQPTAAMRGQSGTRTVNISENIRHLSDPNWLASQGINLNQVSPQQLVQDYLGQLQSKTGNADLKTYLQTRGKSRPATYENTYTDLRGKQGEFKPPEERNIIEGKFETPLQWLEKRKRKN